MMWRSSVLFHFKRTGQQRRRYRGFVSSSFMFTGYSVCITSHLEFPTSRCDVMFGKMKEEDHVHVIPEHDNDTAAQQFAHVAASPF